MTSTTQGLLDALTECRQFLEDMHAMPPEWTVKESQPLHAKLEAILVAANAAPTSKQHLQVGGAKAERAEQTMLDILVHGMSITRIDPTSIYVNPEPQAAPVLDVADERERFERHMHSCEKIKSRWGKLDTYRVPNGDYLNGVMFAARSAWQAAPSQPIAKDEPIAWARNGLKRGDEVMHNISLEPMEGDNWMELYTRPQPQELPVMSDEEILQALADHGIGWVCIDGIVPFKPDESDGECHAAAFRALLSRQPSTESKETGK